RGNDPNDFGQMLVHETSHGFIHRYKTKAQLPNWVDEGMADLIGAEMVPASTAVRNREIKAIQQMAEQRSLGGMLKAERIDGEQSEPVSLAIEPAELRAVHRGAQGRHEVG